MSHSRATSSDYLKSKVKSARLIQLALLGSTIVYGVLTHVIHMMRDEASTPSGGGDDLQVTFSILGLGMCFFASMFHQALLKKLRREAKIKVKSGEKTRGKNKNTLSNIQLERLIDSLFRGSIITWVLAELCAVVGLALSLMLHHESHYTLFGVLSLLTILAHPLSENSLRRVLDER